MSQRSDILIINGVILLIMYGLSLIGENLVLVLVVPYTIFFIFLLRVLIGEWRRRRNQAEIEIMKTNIDGMIDHDAQMPVVYGRYRKERPNFMISIYKDLSEGIQIRDIWHTQTMDAAVLLAKVHATPGDEVCILDLKTDDRHFWDFQGIAAYKKQ